MYSLSVISENIIINHTLLKSRFFGLHFCWGQYRLNFNDCDKTGSQSYQIQWNDAKQWPVHNAGSLKVTNFSTNQKAMCNFLGVNNRNLPYLLSCTVSKI